MKTLKSNLPLFFHKGTPAVPTCHAFWLYTALCCKSQILNNHFGGTAKRENRYFVSWFFPPTLEMKLGTFSSVHTVGSLTSKLPSITSISIISQSFHNHFLYVFSASISIFPDKFPMFKSFLGLLLRAWTLDPWSLKVTSRHHVFSIPKWELYGIEFSPPTLHLYILL